jgi:hypothetical protein
VREGVAVCGFDGDHTTTDVGIEGVVNRDEAGTWW